MTGDFSPYMLFRRGTLGLPALRGLVPERFWALRDEVEEAARRRAPLGEKLADALYAAVPLSATEHRRELLTIRRAVHNDRMPPPPSRPDLLPGPVRGLLDEWCAERAAADALAATVDEVLATELTEGRHALAEVARGEDFQRGVQLSGEDVYREVMAYAANPLETRRKASRTRRAESTVTSFAYRVALKPSPFGAFTEIGAGPWEPGPTTAVRRTQVRLSVGMVMWMLHQLHRIDGADDLLRVRLNNSLSVRDGRAVFVRRPIEGSEDGFEPDKVVVARHTDLVRVLTAALGAGDLTVTELCGRLAAAGLPEASARDTVEKLIRLGLCHRGLGLPDQTTDLAGEAAVRLRRLGTPQAVTCAEILERLRAIERTYGAASARRRTDLLAQLRALVHRFAEVCGGQPPAPEALRAALYEDVGTTGRPGTWRPQVLAANQDNLDLLQRLVPVLDDATIEKVGLYGFFVRQFGATAQVPLVEVYRRFAELPPAEASAVMCGVADPTAKTVHGLREDFFGLLRSRLAAEPAAEQLVLDPAELTAFVDRLPPAVAPWPSAAYRVQFDAGSGTAVVNGMTTGRGVFFSRFCDLLEPEDGDGWSLAAALRRHVARTGPRQTDITVVLGMNFNLHPRLSPLELVYPGSVPAPDSPATLTLADLTVRADPEGHRLVLVSGRDGQPIDLVPLNFLYPAAAPMLYRFLCVFAPTRTYRGGLWDQLDRADGPYVGPRPRLLLGDLVLDRRSWRFDVDDLPDLARLERYEAQGLADFDGWRRSVGLPRQVFFRLVPPRAVPHGERNLLAETRQWALEARSARLHKPHYLDMRNPFLTHVFAKQARALRGGSVAIHECLPRAADQDGATGAEEFFVEFNRGVSDVG
ncbi:Lantibiotic dehydratase, C terminus [Micromonospora viridifaciens]|uniref:Lantibiotic dehydratase, C terminus n=1 Tax=Micromonospora viridifaciens TaxID=1881 RepID=A0A1C4ZQH0_MICVI|nr:lantibiotic dehydratase [Micromonospora viridifaciens]SCF35215.1 Lantibiotic dehydratase, C terminus [Micromonospora viridifaciens]